LIQAACLITNIFPTAGVRRFERRPAVHCRLLNRSGRCCAGDLGPDQLRIRSGAQKSCVADVTNRPKTSAWNHRLSRRVPRSKRLRRTTRELRRCWFHGNVNYWAFSGSAHCRTPRYACSCKSVCHRTDSLSRIQRQRPRKIRFETKRCRRRSITFLQSWFME
jgi:hypothetical protein